LRAGLAPDDVAALVDPLAGVGRCEVFRLAQRIGAVRAAVPHVVRILRIELEPVRVVLTTPGQAVAPGALRAADLEGEALICRREPRIDQAEAAHLRRAAADELRERRALQALRGQVVRG